MESKSNVVSLEDLYQIWHVSKYAGMFLDISLDSYGKMVHYNKFQEYCGLNIWTNQNCMLAAKRLLI